MQAQKTKKTGTCPDCTNTGSILDPHCLEDTCAHAGVLKTVEEEENGKTIRRKVRERVMACPPRPCRCPAGRRFRDQLKAKAERQYESSRYTRTPGARG